MQLKQQVIIQRRLQQRVTDRDWVVEPEDLEGPPSAYVRKETLVPKVPLAPSLPATTAACYYCCLLLESY